MNNNKYIYLCTWHDRHTDDRFIAYEKAKDAIARCKEIVANNYGERYEFAEQDHGYVFTLFCSDDYFVQVEKIELVA